MRKFLSLFTAILFAGSMMAADYVKVTKTSDITDGNYLIVYETTSLAFDGSLETLDATGNGVSVTIADGKIASSETVDAYAFTLDVEAGTIKSSSGHYIGVTSNSNGLKQNDDASTYSHTFAIDEDGNADVFANFSGSTMYLRYNASTSSNNLRFRYYKNRGQQPIALYKYVATASGDDNDEEQESTTKTLYCKVAQDWWKADGAAVGIYAFKGEATNAEWPGVRMTAVEGETDLWKADIDTALYNTVIFVRVSGTGDIADYGAQTEDLTVPADKDLYTITSTSAQWSGQGNKVTGTWSVYTAQGGDPVEEPAVIKFHGNFTGDWANTDAFTLSEDKKTATLKLTLNKGNYEFGMRIGADDNWTSNGVAFTRENNSAAVVAGENNLTLDADTKGDYNFTWTYATNTLTIDFPEYVETLPEMQIAGAWDVDEVNNAWVLNTMTNSDDKKTATYKVTLTKGDYEFKVIKDGDWLAKANEGNAYGLHREWTGVAGVVDKNTAENLKLTADENGEYTFVWTFANDSIGIIFPEKIIVPVMAENYIFHWDADDAKVIGKVDMYGGIVKATTKINTNTTNIDAINLNTSYKYSDGKYVVIKPARGKFLAGDTIEFATLINNATTDGSKYGRVQFYAADGTTKIFEGQDGINGRVSDDAPIVEQFVLEADQDSILLGRYGTTATYVSILNVAREGGVAALPCEDGPYAIRINGTDLVETVAGEEFDGYKQYVAYLSLSKGDSIQLINTSCGATWLPAIEEGGMSAHFKKGVNAATIDTTGCFDLYIKMKDGDDKLYIGAGICPEDTIRFTVVGDGEALGDWDLAEGLQSKENTLEVNLKAGDYKLKVVDQNNFWFGFEQLSEVAEGLKSLDDDKNIGFTLKEDGKVTFTLIKTATDTTFTLAGNFYYYQPTLVDLKLVPGVWAEADAKIAAWAWTRKEGAEMVDQWTPFFAPIAEGNDTLSVKIDAAADSIQFIRFNKAVESPVWSDAEDVIWNRLASDSIVKESMTYTITDWAAGTWDVYVPAKYYIVGDSALVGSKDLAWNPAAIKVTEDSKVLDLEAGSYMMKITLKGDWEHGVLGYDALTGEKPAGITRGEGDNNDNICFTLKEAGQVTVSYIATETDTTFTVAGNFYYYQPTLVDLKLVPGVWAEADAKIAAWAWTRKEGAEMVDQWTPFFAPIAEGNDTLSVKIDAAADSIQFIRFNKAVESPVWSDAEDVIWNRLASDSIVKESMTYTITDWAAGTWDVYVPAKFYVTGDSALVTDAGFAGKAWNADAIKSENDTLVLNLKADQDYILKVAVNGTWEGENNVKGYNELSEKTEGLLDIGNDHNIGFRLNAAGEVKVVYIAAEGENPEIFKLIGDFYVAPAPDPTVSVKGSMNDWAEEIPFVLSDDKTYASLTVENIGADNYDFKFIINGEWRSNGYTYHRDFPGAAGITENNDANMVFQADVDGEYTFYWYFANDSAAIVYPEKPEPVMNDGYYIIGLNSWNVADLTADDMFWSTGIETGEFSINLTLRLNDEFKVVRIVDDMIQEWYPAEGGNYVVDDHHYGATTVYFRPNYDGNEDWFAGCIYVLPTSTVDIDNLDTNAPAVKILRDGQILIIKGTKTFNIQGQLVK